MSLLKDLPHRLPDQPGATHRLRPVPNHFLILILVTLSGLLSSCIIVPKRVGGYPVTGTVVDSCTGAPVEGATVFLRYHGVSAYSGAVEVDGEPVLADVHGKFYIPPKRLTLMGGIGGLSGKIRRWPTVISFTADLGRGQMSPYIQRDKESTGPQTYQDVVVKIRKNGVDCPIGSQTGK